MTHLVYLASNSPRRLQLLQSIGLEPQKIEIDVDESVYESEGAIDYVKRVSRLKAEAARLKRQQLNLPQAPIVTADTTVSLIGQIMGKPLSALHAKKMLKTLSGQTHQVITSVCIVTDEQFFQETVLSDVRFKLLSECEIDAYIATGEPLDKAGAYGIQSLGGMFVNHLSGSYSGVVGLPLYETALLLKRAGIHVL